MLHDDIAADMAATNDNFERLVWPVVSDLMGAQSLHKVETARGRGADRMLDMHGGIDYVVVTPDGLPYGVAARIQGGDYRTFAMRLERNASGRR